MAAAVAGAAAPGKVKALHDISRIGLLIGAATLGATLVGLISGQGNQEKMLILGTIGGVLIAALTPLFLATRKHSRSGQAD